MRAVRAVRAAGVGHGLEPVKHCFSWQGRWRGGENTAFHGRGASASGGGGEGGVGGVGGEGGGGWAWTPVKHCFSWQRWGR